MKERTIASWIAEAALSCVQTQRILDRAYLDGLAALTPAAVPEGLPPELLAALIPARQVISSHEAEFSLALGRTHLAEFALGAQVVNLNYMVSFRARRERHSRFRVTVKNCPIAQNGDSNA